jgi:hypothetical protein
MEVRDTIHTMNEWMRRCLAIGLLLFICGMARSQEVNRCAIKNGQMFIELSQNAPETTLKSFIDKYNLKDIGLHQLIKTKSPDSLRKLGWKVELSNTQTYLISKTLQGFDKFNDPADKIIFTEKHPTLAEMFPAVNNGVLFGYNRFRNKPAFYAKGNVVTFFLRGYSRARRVMLAGSFNQWNPEALSMTKTDSGWIANVQITPGKYWYKFIADGNWMVDDDNMQRENDGRGNINSVFYKSNVVFRLNGFVNARRVYLAGSFNSWRPKDLAMNQAATGWELPMYLADGTHTYRFVVDGDWYVDPGNKEKLPNEFGDFNSVVRLGKPHLFTLPGYTNARQVVLTGSFNNWRRDELYMNKTASGWELPYTLGSGNYEYRFIVDGKPATDPQNPLTTQGSQNTRNSYLIIDPNYTFRLYGYPNAKNVFLAGDFNNWSPGTLAMKKDGDVWTFSVHLSVGKHQYKFIVDGNWIIDPRNKLWEQNEFRNGNSVIWIDK